MCNPPNLVDPCLETPTGAFTQTLVFGSDMSLANYSLDCHPWIIMDHPWIIMDY